MRNNLTYIEVEGGIQVEYVWQTYRFLLQGGRTIDVRAVWDDSHLRDLVLKATGSPKIEGVTVVEEPAPAPEESKAKKVPAKRAPARA